MQTVNIHEAKTHLSRFVDQAAAGEEILIARAGKPIARLVALTKEMGFYGLDIPEEFGGPGLDTTTRALMAMEMSQHRAGCDWSCTLELNRNRLTQLFRWPSIWRSARFFKTRMSDFFASWMIPSRMPSNCYDGLPMR